MNKKSKSSRNRNVLKIPQNILTWEDAEKYFANVKGNVVSTPEKLEEHLLQLNQKPSTENEAISLAALNKFVGISHLKEDNPAKAKDFFDRCIHHYKNMKHAICDDKKLEADLKMEADIYSNFAMVRNYDQLSKAVQFLCETLKQKLKPSNYALICLTVVEIQSYHDVEMIEKFDVGENFRLNVVADRKDYKKVLELEPLYREFLAIKQIRHDCKVVYHSSLIESDYFGNVCGQFSLKKEERLNVAKFLLRHQSVIGNPQYSELFYKCELLVEKTYAAKGIFDSCSVANNLFQIGCRSPEDKQAEYYASCLKIRRAKLGESHAQTAIAKFHVAGTEDANDESFKAMEESLNCLERHSYGDLLQYYHIVLVYVIRLQLFFKTKTALDCLQKYLKNIQDNKSPLFRDPARIRIFSSYGIMLLRELGKWQLALDWFQWYDVLKVESLELMTRFMAASSAAYCYFKVGDYPSAKKLFKYTNENCSEIENSSAENQMYWLHFKFCECEFLLHAEPHEAERMFRIMCTVCPIDFEMLYPNIKVHLAFIYETVGRSLTKAEQYYHQGLEDWKQNHVHSYPRHCDCLLGLSRVYLKQGKIKDCEKYAWKFIDLSSRLFEPPDQHFEPAIEIFQQLMEYRKDITKMEKFFVSYKENFSRVGLTDDSSFVALFSHNFAKMLYDNAHFGSTDFKKCAKIFGKSFRVLVKVLGAKNKKTAESQRMLGLCNMRLGNVGIAEWHLLNSAITLLPS